MILPDDRCFLCRQGSVTGSFSKFCAWFLRFWRNGLLLIHSFTQFIHSSDLLGFCQSWSQAPCWLDTESEWIGWNVRIRVAQSSWGETVDRALKWFFAKIMTCNIFIPHGIATSRSVRCSSQSTPSRCYASLSLASQSPLPSPHCCRIYSDSVHVCQLSPVWSIGSRVVMCKWGNSSSLNVAGKRSLGKIAEQEWFHVGILYYIIHACYSQGDCKHWYI